MAITTLYRRAAYLSQKEHEHTVSFKIFFAQSSCVYLSLAGYVEALASRLGLSIPELTPKQADMWQTRLSAHLVSVDVYCLLLWCVSLPLPRSSASVLVHN